jgi:hypothetical protein
METPKLEKKLLHVHHETSGSSIELETDCLNREAAIDVFFGWIGIQSASQKLTYCCSSASGRESARRAGGLSKSGPEHIRGNERGLQ